MKLIDLLVQELPKHGGWPEWADEACSQGVGKVMFYFQGNLEGDIPVIVDVTSRQEDVTREQYEAALAASKTLEWSGEGLPPVGCECELFDCEDWNPVRIKFVGDKYVVTERTALGYEVVYCVAERPERFRPIRTKAERKRDEFAKSLCTHLDDLTDWDSPVGNVHALAIYDAIAAGKIPHITLK